ncbi:MAG TPA: rRNA maturation RNase YbeY [Gemmatimonadota bacterium]|nr:rRNA maturation RNase YbeY [Gemmatimonadota bacterium]
MAPRIRFHASVAPPPELDPFPSGALERVLREAGGIDAGEVHCVLTDDAEMTELNERFRGKPGPTDVLAFPYDPVTTGGALGDVYVSLERAAEQAAERGETLAREVWRLFVHGTLHLAGHEHDTASGERRMIDRQEAWVERVLPQDP